MEFCDIEISFHGKSCGVESVVTDGYATYDIWCGEEPETYNSADDLLDALLFDDKSLRQIAEQIDFFIYKNITKLTEGSVLYGRRKS